MNYNRILSRFTFEDIVSAVNGVAYCGEAFEFEGIDACQTDSRGEVSHALFIALVGERFDGHDYIENVWEGGGQVVLVSKLPEKILTNKAAILVSDTCYAFGELARALLEYRRKAGNFTVFGITGSNGKTTTKEMLALCLEAAQKKVLKTFGNYNNWIGLPMTVARLEVSHDVAVLEMGTNAVGEIRRLVEIAEPDEAILTSVGEAHLLGFGSLEGVARAKGEILEGQRLHAIYLPVSLKCFYDESNYPEIRFFWFGSKENAYIDNFQENLDGSKFEIVTLNRRTSFHMPLLGKHNAENFGLAFLATQSLAIPEANLVNRLHTLVLPSGRLERRCIGCVNILFDAYNANPTSMRAGLEILKNTTIPSQRFLILGEMGELGTESSRLHGLLGEEIAKLCPRFLCIIGTDLAQSLLQGAIKAGLPKKSVFCVNQDKLQDAIQTLCPLLRAGDVVLVKGSRSAKLERVLPLLEERLNK